MCLNVSWWEIISLWNGVREQTSLKKRFDRLSEETVTRATLKGNKKVWKLESKRSTEKRWFKTFVQRVVIGCIYPICDLLFTFWVKILHQVLLALSLLSLLVRTFLQRQSSIYIYSQKQVVTGIPTSVASLQMA